jgi:hypothetical protein
MKTDTTLSRRRLLAGVPAVAAIGVPSVATAPGGLATGDDPIFAAIERHREAFESYSNTDEVHIRLREEHEAQRDPRGIYLGEGPEVEYVRIIREIGENRCVLPAREIHTGRIVPIFATFATVIEENVPKSLTVEVDIEAWKAEKYREFEQWHGLYDGAPISVAWTAWNAAHDVLRDAAEALKIPPTTLAGLEALLNYVGEFPDDESWTNEDEEIDFLREVMIAAAEALTH